MNYKIAPSILSANFSKLGEDIKEITPYADWLHIDVMDGHFVPNLTIGPLVVAALREETSLFFDVHLMISNPEAFVEPFAKAGADLICVHLEATKHLHRLLQKIKELGKKTGVALNPATPWEWVLPVIEDVDLILLMTVNPGFGGQKFIQTVVPKIKKLREFINQHNLKVDLEVDGGIGPATLNTALSAGANVFVAGAAVFGQPSKTEALKEMRKIIEMKGVPSNAL